MGLKTIHLDSEAEVSLEKIKKEDSSFNFSSWVSGHLKDFRKKDESIEEKEFRLQKLDNECERIEIEKEQIKEEIVKLKIKKEEEIKDESKRIEKENFGLMMNLELWTDIFMDEYGLSLEKSRNLANEYLDIPKSKRETIWKFAKEKGLSLKS